MTILRITSDGSLRSIGGGDVRAVDASGPIYIDVEPASMDLGFSMSATPALIVAAVAAAMALTFTMSAQADDMWVEPASMDLGFSMSAEASVVRGASAAAAPLSLDMSPTSAVKLISAVPEPVALALGLATTPSVLRGASPAPMHIMFGLTAKPSLLWSARPAPMPLAFTMSATPATDGSVNLRDRFLALYAARQTLLNAIDADNRARANAAQSAVETEAATRLVAINAAVATAAAAAQAKVDAAKAVLEASIAVLNGQVADITNADVYDPYVAYPHPSLVQDGGSPAHLYRSKQAVPAGVPLSNTDYWQLIGDYASLGEAVAATAVIVATNTTELESAASSLAVIVARMPTGTDQLANEARVVTAQNAAATATSAVASALATLSGTVSDPVTGLAAKASNDDLSTAVARLNDTGAGKTVEVVASDVAALGTELHDPDTGLAAKASNTRVSTVEGRLNNTGAGKTVEVVASDVAALGTELHDPDTGLAAKASNTRVSTVEGRLNNTGAGKTVEVVASDVAAMGTAVNNPTTGLSAINNSLDAINLAINQQDDFSQATADDLASIDSEVRNASTGLAARALQTDFATTAAQVSTNTGAISAQSTLLNTVKASIGESPDNLVKKGTFSSDASIGQWSAGSVVPNGGLHASQAYLMSQSGNAYENTTFPVMPGDRYDISIDVHTANVTSSYISVGIGTFTASGTPDFALVTDSTKAGFHTLTGRVTIPAGAVLGRPVTNLAGAIYWTNFRIDRVSTAAAQNAEASTLLTARVGSTESGLAIAQAAWGFTLDVNGKAVGAYAMNDGTTGKLDFNMDEVTFSSGSGNGTSIIGGIIVQRKGGYMTVEGPGFGASGNLLAWFGPDMPVANCTTANATTFKTITGEIPETLPPPTGTEIKFNAASESTASPNTLQLVNNNTAGASKTVTVNYYFSSMKIDFSSAPGSNGSATLSLWRKVGTGSFVQLGATQNVVLYESTEPGTGSRWRHTTEGGCQLTVTDADASTSNHTYEWRLTARSNSYPATMQTMTIKTLES